MSLVGRFTLRMSWICQILAAFILAQSLYLKFTGAPEADWIFSQLGVESWGRYVVAVLELCAVILLLVPQLAFRGACLGLIVTSGAILAHVFILGVVLHPPSMPMGDAGGLFGMAVIAWICCLVVLRLRRGQLDGRAPGAATGGLDSPV